MVRVTIIHRLLFTLPLLATLGAAPATRPATAPATSQVSTVGVVFTPPANWQKVERDGLTIYVAPGA